MESQDDRYCVRGDYVLVKCDPAMSFQFGSLFTRFVVPAFDRQLRLFNSIGERSWIIDLKTCLLSFGDKYRWRFQLLGTESEATGTWLWALANTESKIPGYLLVASLTLKAYGEQYGIPELTTPQLPLDQMDSHTLALFASGVCEANAYFRCPYDGGALFVLIMDENFPKCTDQPLQRIATVFPQAIASLEILDHRLAFMCYLDSYKLIHEQHGDKIVVKENDEPMLTATFDEQNRLTNLEATLKRSAEAKGETWDEGQLRRMLGG